LSITNFEEKGTNTSTNDENELILIVDRLASSGMMVSKT
jgi:hypothetical protein